MAHKLRRKINLEAQVRYGPEISALGSLLREAQMSLVQGVNAEQGAASGIKAALKAAKPQITKQYAQVGGTYNQAQQDVEQDFSTLSAAADPIRAVAAREAAGARRRLADALQGAQTELTQRQVGAEQGRAFAVRGLIGKYQDDVARIGVRRQSLAGEIGAFKLKTLNDIQAANTKARFERARLGIQREGLRIRQQAAGLQRRKTIAGLTGTDPVTGRPVYRAPRRGRSGGSGGISPARRGKYQDQLDTTFARSGRYISGGRFVGRIRTGKNSVQPASFNLLYQLAVDAGVPPLIAEAAIVRRLKGGVKAPMARRLKRKYGVNIRTIR